MNLPIRVLVVDDSAFARKVVREVLEAGDGFEVVGIARDGLDALEKIAELSPDVVTLDLVMPNLDGVGVLTSLASAQTRPAVVVVSMTGGESELGVAALALGAFDIVTKPTALATDELYDLGAALRKTVAAAARGVTRSERVAPVAPLAPVHRQGSSDVVLIGASTGGPQAISLLLKALPGSFPAPIAIVIHMPEGYTEPFARRLNAESALSVMEARDGLVLRPGMAVIGRAGVHLTFEADRDSEQALVCRLGATERKTAHRPSVDVMFESGAAVAGARVLAVVLTGMGSDGLAGAEAIARAGGRTLTEAEDSCVVYGMPRSVVEAGLSVAQANIESMAALILNQL